MRNVVYHTVVLISAPKKITCFSFPFGVPFWIHSLLLMFIFSSRLIMSSSRFTSVRDHRLVFHFVGSFSVDFSFSFHHSRHFISFHFTSPRVFISQQFPSFHSISVHICSLQSVSIRCDSNSTLHFTPVHFNSSLHSTSFNFNSLLSASPHLPQLHFSLNTWFHFSWFSFSFHSFRFTVKTSFHHLVSFQTVASACFSSFRTDAILILLFISLRSTSMHSHPTSFHFDLLHSTPIHLPWLHFQFEWTLDFISLCLWYIVAFVWLYIIVLGWVFVAALLAFFQGGAEICGGLEKTMRRRQALLDSMNKRYEQENALWAYVRSRLEVKRGST